MLTFVDALFEPIADATGASVDDLKQVSTFLLSYPLTGLLKRLPDSKPWTKNLFIASVSMFYLVGLFDLWDGLRTLLYCSFGAYAIAYYIDGSMMPWIGFIFLMGYMSASHIFRQIINSPSTMDITGAQMVLIMKMSAFCWNVHDGRLPDEQLSEAQKYAAIREFPSFLDFVGYAFFFPSLFAGPAFDYVEYKQWIQTTMFELPPGIDPSKAPPTRKKRKIPRSGRPAMRKLFEGLVGLGAFMYLGPIFGTDALLGDKYMQYGFLRRVWILHIFGVTTRLKYYGVWALTEGACILSGMGYNGVDAQTGQVYWNKLENVNPYDLETAQSPRTYLDSWNKGTNHWLRNYVYLRVTPKGKKPGFRASLATFATSAVWHGFYPGYYFTFLLGAFVQTSAKKFRRHIRPFFLTPDGTKPTPYKKYYDIASWLTTQSALSFIVAPFVILHFKDCITIWANVHFYCIIGIAISMIFFASPAKAFLIRRLNERNKAAAAAGQRRQAKTSPSQESKTQTKTKDEERKEIAASKARERALTGAVESAEDQPNLPALGMPEDLAQDVEDALQEIRGDIESRRRRGSVVTMPTGAELVAALEERVGKKLT